MVMGLPIMGPPFTAIQSSTVAPPARRRERPGDIVTAAAAVTKEIGAQECVIGLKKAYTREIAALEAAIRGGGGAPRPAAAHNAGVTDLLKDRHGTLPPFFLLGGFLLAARGRGTSSCGRERCSPPPPRTCSSTRTGTSPIYKEIPL